MRIKRFGAGLVLGAFLVSASVLPFGALSGFAASPNVIANPSLETASAGDLTMPDQWQRGNWGSNQTAFSYPVTGVAGAAAARITMTQYTSGDAKWFFNDVAVHSGDVYFFSDQYSSDVTTDVTIQYRSSGGALSYAWLATPSATAGSWGQVQATFTVPSNMVAVTIFHNIHSVGSLTVDNFSLVKDTPPPPPTGGNVIPNAQLEPSADPSTPTSWQRGGWGNNTRSLTYPATGPNGEPALKTQITSYTDGDAKWFFTPVAVRAGDSYAFSENYQSNATTNLTVQYQMSDGSYSYAWLLSAPATGTAWSQAKANITIPANAAALTIFHALSSIGTLTTADESLVKATPPPPQDPDNLIPNAALSAGADPSQPLHWHTSSWGSNQPVFTYPAVGYNSGAGLEVQLTNASSGDAKWYFDAIPVTPGDTLKYTDYYQADVPTTVTAAFGMTDGSFRYLDVAFPSATSSWTAANAIFSVPSGASSLTILHIINRVGSLTTSGFSLKHAPSLAFDQGMVSMTFDDGFRTVYSQARPMLNAAGYKASIYIVTNFLNTPDYMSTTQVKQLSTEGHEIGGHTRNHLDLTTLTPTQLKNEVQGNRTDLLNLGLKPVTTFAYPFGAYNDQVIQAVKDAGYIGARSVNSGFDNKLADHYLLMDQHVESTVTADQIKTWIDQALADKKWLILELHDQNAAGDQWSNDPAVLQATIDYLKLKNVKVVTISQGMTMLNP